MIDVPTRKREGYIGAVERPSRLAMSREDPLRGRWVRIVVIDLKSRKATASIQLGRSPRAVIIDD